MAHRKRKKQHEDPESMPLSLNPEAKRGILMIFLFAVAAILFLSYFELAGITGVELDNIMAMIFGWDRLLLPVLLVIIGASLTFERVRLTTFNYIGILFFFLSFNALSNLAAFRSEVADASALSVAGGYIGGLLYHILLTLVGFWGALVICAAILVVSIMLIFNTSLRSVFTVHTHVTGRIGSLLHRRSDEPSYDEASEDEEDEVQEESDDAEEPEEEEDEEPAKPFKKTPVAAPALAHIEPEPEEKVLSSRTRRKVEIALDLLETRNSKAAAGDVNRTKEVIQKTFAQFGIDVEMSDVSIGPTVTQYSLHPAEGVKLARIVALQNDLALALAAHPIRIEAPIPGKSLVGIEVPNHTIAMVSLRDLIDSKKFKARESNMTVALGKDVSGNAWLARLDKMPHLLVAGATGSGKSVCLHTLILSLLYQNGPDDLKFIMVDPKRVELTVYTGIPHLLVPPITKVDETVNALKWTVREMERRLDVLAKFGARELDGYNAKAEAKIPKLVVIIDELADLMATSRNEVEGMIVRIAQMARAVGIHLVLATQRPSVDVITGVIKANIPARIAFAVASQIDSRTILDASGAEKLLGRGDMLYSSAELGKPKRLQGPFVSDGEIEKIVTFLRQAGTPDYNYVITEKQKTGTVLDGMGGEDGDPMLEDAIQVVLESGKASTSLLQRRLKLGYARAARIVDLLEQNGIVGPADGAKPREILITEWPPADAEVQPQAISYSQQEVSGIPAADPSPLDLQDDAPEKTEKESSDEDWFIDDSKKS